MLGALGAVFGDIGTSPLYAIQTAFTIDDGAVAPTRGDVYGVISLVFWAITLIVLIKYVSLIMRADNDGEGGIIALVALVQRSTRSVAINTAVLVGLGIFGASLFYGDSVITPAISVLSAVEGLKVAAPELSDLVVPIALAVLTALFAIQRWGTHVVGRLFGPLVLFWFAAIAAAGLREVAIHPDALQDLSPTHAVAFLVDDPGVAFVALGAVVLVVTGAEALYADMGHFGRRPISRAWFAVVFPADTQLPRTGRTDPAPPRTTSAPWRKGRCGTSSTSSVPRTRRSRACRRRLPQPEYGDDAAGHAGERRVQPRPARARCDRHGAHGRRPARAPARPRRGRRPRLRRRRHRSRHRPLRLRGRPRRPRRAAPRPGAGLECDLDLDLDGPGPAYFVSRIALTAGDARGLRRWWKKLFVVLARNAASPVQYFKLPIDRTVTVGSTIEV